MAQINIKVFDSDINFIGEIDNYTSLLYERKWSTYAEFEFHTSRVNLELLQTGNIIVVGNDEYRAGVIEHIEDNETDKKDITVKGYGLLYYFTNRITVPPTGQAYHTFNTDTESIMLSLVDYNAINSVDPLRRIELLENPPNKNRGNLVNFQTRYKNLAEELTKLSNHSNLGLNLRLDYKNKKLIFDILEGRDLSYSQDINSPIIFSKKYDNITNRNYIESDIGYKNVGYVAGQGEGAERELIVVNNNLSGINRRELFIDARDISEGESLSLEDRGKLKLAENIKIQSFECEVNTRDYRNLWNLGDIITVKDDELNITQDYRIVEIKEIYEVGGSRVEALFGTTIPTLIDKVKQSNDVPISEPSSVINNITNNNTVINNETYVYTQISPSNLWTIEHNLNKYPAATVVDSGGSQVIGDVRYITSNSIEISFQVDFAGTVYLN